MAFFTDQTEFADVHVFQTVINMFERRPRMQSILKHSLGLQFDYESFPDEDDYDRWVHHDDDYGVYLRHSERSDDRGNHASTSSNSPYQSPLQLYASSNDPSSLSSAKENDTERKARLLEESKKSKGKSQKKKKKKLKQKERRRREKLEKEKQKEAKNEEGKDGAQQLEAEENKTVNYEEHTSCSGKLMAAAEDTLSSDSSEQESSDEDGDTKYDSCASEELDMTSTFVSKAALIAKRKLEQKPIPMRTEKKKVTDKEERKSTPEKPNEDQEAEKSSAAVSSPTFEDNMKISTDLAVIGNKFASAGDFNMAVKFFTDAIKYNPTEFKLFGNRSFCFEKLQEYDKALTDAELSLGICPGWVKGLFRKGRALTGLKRYDEAAGAFRDVLKLDGSCTEAAQELMRVQITQLMECGFTREQSSNALIIHGTVEKALGVLSKLNRGPGVVQNSTFPSVQVANVTGVSPVLSAKANPARAAAPPPPAPAQDAPKNPLMNKPLVPVQNMSDVYYRPLELFPVWVGNLNYAITESMITSLFNKVGVVYSMKHLFSKGCAFVNFTKQECCDEAIRRFHGYELGGVKIAVRYPDRIPPGLGISKSALRSKDLWDENLRQNEHTGEMDAVGNRRPTRPYKHAPNYSGNN